MSDEMTFTLHNPLTEEEWDMITDVDLDHTSEITFHTKHGKEVVFVKRKLPPAQPEPTLEQIEEYCHKRCLSIVDNALLHKYAQPETAKRIVGKSKDGMTLWYQCDMCNEPVDAQDNFCSGCGRRLTNG